ncbi:MAG: NADH-quinone oxidoreductase subunit N [candidate division Zixibacteria bacterium]|nr:NADH-quinone oxidoreductase subunit N [candidate division Zixibacteria bacterium]
MRRPNGKMQNIDIKFASLNLGLISPEMVLLVGGILILILGGLFKQRAIIVYTALVTLLGGLILSIGAWNNPESGFYGMVQVDNFSIFFKIIFILASSLTLLMARQYLIRWDIERFEFYSLLLFSTVGMMTMASSVDLIVIFLGLEIMSVPLYVMAGFARRDPLSNEAGIKYFIMGAFATGFLLYGIALIYGASGTTNLRQIVADFGFLQTHSALPLYIGAGLVLVGFGFKVAAVPFHMWVPDVYQGAPTPITAFFSVAPKAAGFASLFRIFAFGFSGIPEMTSLLWLLAILTMSVGNILALYQDNIKRMLAYSSIAHAGYILIALTVKGEGAVSAALYYLLAYTFFNLGAFTIVTMVDSRARSQALIHEMRGLSIRHPYLAALLALFLLALAGFPPTAGFLGKFYIFSEAVKGGYIWLAIIGVINSLVSVYYYLRIVVAAYFDQRETEFQPVTYTPALRLVLFITAAGTLILGLWPQYFLHLTRINMFPFI